jgi:hypothetical protein
VVCAPCAVNAIGISIHSKVGWLPPVAEEHPADRARREWDAFQVFRANNLGEPGNALGPGEDHGRPSRPPTRGREAKAHAALTGIGTSPSHQNGQGEVAARKCFG